MKRIRTWLTGPLLLWLGCTVPDFQELEKDAPLACDAQHACLPGYQCLEGLCCTQSTAYYLDEDGDGYGPLASARSACVAPSSAHVALGGDCNDNARSVHPNAPELCNAKDDDCDGTADNGLEVGSACTSDEGCGGTFACGADGSRFCDGPRRVALYEDQDGDSYGASDKMIMSCVPARAGYVSRGGDCNDTLASARPGAQEVCDGADNDCDGPSDEDFNVGASCDPGRACQGRITCQADGSARCAYVTPPSLWYPDEDRDTYGRSAAGVLTCSPPAGYSTKGEDCDEGNPFIHPDARELCDSDDNDCDGLKDEGACLGGRDAWGERVYGMTDWRTAAVWGEGGVWIAGGVDKLLVYRPGDEEPISISGECGGAAWYAVAADPTTGTAYLGGDKGRTASIALTTGLCNPGPPISNTDLRGMFRLPLQSRDAFELHAVGLDSAKPLAEGRAAWLDSRVSGTHVQETGPLLDVHGVSRDVMFAVGGGTNSPVLYRFNTLLNEWVGQELPSILRSRLQGVWVVHDRLAYAVGENNTVLKWNGESWNTHTGPAPGESLNAVLAFGTSSLYVVTSTGRVSRFNGTEWREQYRMRDSTALWDIAGRHPNDIWVVGASGKIGHSPY